MPRVIWQGAIAFGLVHIPVSLYPASGTSEIELNLLDKRDLAPVGCQRINERTGKPVSPDDIVNGYEYQAGRYVVISDEDLHPANGSTRHTVNILGFVNAADIPPCFFDRPYYLEPGKDGEKGYALLRETLRRSGRVGVATVMIGTRQQLAAVMPVNNVLLLNALRFADEICSTDALDIPDDNLEQLGVSPKELDMAARLIDDLSEDWTPERYRDACHDELMVRIERKIKAGRSQIVTEPEDGEAPAACDEVTDPMALPKGSLDVKRLVRSAAKSPRVDSPARHAERGGRTGEIAERHRRRA